MRLVPRLCVTTRPARRSMRMCRLIAGRLVRKRLAISPTVGCAPRSSARISRRVGSAIALNTASVRVSAGIGANSNHSVTHVKWARKATGSVSMRKPRHLTNVLVNASIPPVHEVEVIDDPAAAAAALEPARARLLAELAEPASAAALAERLGIPRQKVNYHLRALEAHGLVREVDTRKWGGLTERRLAATASGYVVSPAALGPAATTPARAVDRLSAGYLIALAARVVREVGELVRAALKAKQRLATLSIDTEIRFRSAAERAAFSQELASSIADLAARYHDTTAAGGRLHRVVVLAHPVVQSCGQPRPS